LGYHIIIIVMFSHNSYFLLWWTLYFVLPDNMNQIQVDASSASSSSSSSATSPLSGVVNIVGRRREVSRSTLDDASFDDVTINDINDNISGVQQEQQQRICACQPSWYTLRLNRSLDCDDRTIFTNRQAGIQSVMCTHPQDKTANALTAISSGDGRPYVPTRIDTVIIQELDMRGKVLKQETMHGPFADGTEITYISILATTATTASPSSATLQKNSKEASRGSHHHQTTTTTPSPSPSIQNDLINNNIKGDEHHNNNNNNLPVRLEIKFLGYPGGSVWSMAYSQDCLGGPILEKGHTIVRAVLVRFVALHLFPYFPFSALTLVCLFYTTLPVGCWHSSGRILSGRQTRRGCGGSNEHGRGKENNDDSKKKSIDTCNFYSPLSSAVYNSNGLCHGFHHQDDDEFN
jgi:hypothetical protein